MTTVVATEKWGDENEMLVLEPPYDSSPRNTPATKASSKEASGMPCALAYLDGAASKTNKSKKTLPAIKSREAMVETPARNGNLLKDFIPIDILNSLTQAAPPSCKEHLGPPARFKKPSTLDRTGIRKRPANVWNYNKGRDRLKHLVENPPCLCGAGRDISFLYDALADTKKTGQPSSDGQMVKKEQVEEPKDGISATDTPKDGTLIPCTLVPDEYHLVKNPGVLGLEFTDDNHTTHLEKHEEHLTVFPSMKPAGRQEVLKLKHAFDTLLSKAGVDDENKELTGPTQIHNLLEIVKKEQSIYNIVFNELIRQCTVECVERGELLASLRKRYAQLLDRIPRQVMSLHQEVLAQRALDRRLTEELIRFKASVSSLTNELCVVKAHDHEVTKQAMLVQQELNDALWESEKNANLLEEYHELYELQRKRLEAFVRTLTEERDLWGSASYILALKVTDHHKLNVAKRLHLHERAWSKLARHFSLAVGQKDSEQLHDVVTNFHLWKELAEKLNSHLVQQENVSRENLQKILSQLEKWKREFERVVSPDQGKVQPFGKEMVSNLLDDIKGWEEICNKESEQFSGGNLLHCNENLYHLYNRVEEWSDVAHKVFRRHQQSGRNAVYVDEMSEINEQIEQLHQQFQNRANGENGVAKRLIDLSNPMESWSNKLTSVVKGAEELLDPEWIRLADQVGNEWLESTTETLALVGSAQREDDDCGVDSKEKKEDVSFDDLCKSVKTWLTNTTNTIESEDGKLMQMVSDIHSKILRWMITVLLRLAPDVEDTDLEEISSEDDLKGALGGGDILMESTSSEIINRASSLAMELREYSDIIKGCCSDFVMDIMLEKKDRYEEDAEVEYNDLQRIAKECEGWITTSQILVKQVLGELPLEGIKLPAINQSPSTAPQTPKQASQGTPSTPATPLKSSERTTSVDSDALPRTPRDAGAEDGTPETLVVVHSEESGDGQTVVVDQTVAPPGALVDKNKVHVLAGDDTVRTRRLDKKGTQQGEVTEDENGVVEETSSFEAISTVEKLQSELIDAEERAQKAEQRALNAENELKIVMEKMRSLERLAARTDSALSSANTSPRSPKPGKSTTTIRQPARSTTKKK